MKVLVTVKEIAEVADDFEIAGTGIDERYLDYDLNEWDDYAVEEAVQARENGVADEVVAVTIGPERSEETIRMALAKGADRAVRVWDDALADAGLLDVAAKTEILSAVVETEEPDLVLTGVQANDDAFGATGVSLADALGFEWAAVVNALDLESEADQSEASSNASGETASADAGAAHVHRELEGGVDEVTEVELPAVLTIQTGINEPRYASLRGIRQAQRKEIDVQSLGDLDLDASVADSALELTSMYEPEAETEATYFEGDADEQAARLAELLREKGVVEA